MAKGRVTHTMDAKGRITLPSEFRLLLKPTPQDRDPVLTVMIDNDALEFYPHEIWTRIEQSLKAKSRFNPRVRDATRMLVGNASDCPIDAQGRVLIPPPLRESAGLQREVVIAATGDTLEIWDKERFDRKLKSTQAQGPEIAGELGDLGL
jgi:MraZ protein